MGMEDHKDITNVLKAVQEIGCVQAPIPKASNEKATTLTAAATQSLSTIESPSMSTAPVRHCSCPPVATPQVVPTPDPSPSTPYPSPSPTILSPTPHPSLHPPYIHPFTLPTSIVPSSTPHPCPGFDILPPTPRSFPELSPIPSFN